MGMIEKRLVYLQLKQEDGTKTRVEMVNTDWVFENMQPKLDRREVMKLLLRLQVGQVPSPVLQGIADEIMSLARGEAL